MFPYQILVLIEEGEEEEMIFFKRDWGGTLAQLYCTCTINNFYIQN